MLTDLRFALRRLRKSPGFTFVVVLTLALGIGANAAIFTLVRGVLLKPLVNRDEDRLIYIRQSAPGIGNENTTWSMPEIQDLKARVKTLSEFGDFSTHRLHDHRPRRASRSQRRRGQRILFPGDGPSSRARAPHRAPG